MKDNPTVKVITKIEGAKRILPIKYTPDFIGDTIL